MSAPSTKQRKQALLNRLMLAEQMAEEAINDAIVDHEKPWRFNLLLGFQNGIAAALTLAEEDWDIAVLKGYISRLLG